MVITLTCTQRLSVDIARTKTECAPGPEMALMVVTPASQDKGFIHALKE